jgi:hypothetical protein
MKSNLAHLAAYTMVFGLLSLVGRAHADDSRQFAGGFEIVSTSAVDADTVKVRIRLRVQNVSGHSVANALVLLADYQSGPDLGSFPGLMDAAKAQIVQFEETFTVPNEVMHHLRAGTWPRFRITYQDANGRAHIRPIDSLRMSSAGEVSR